MVWLNHARTADFTIAERRLVTFAEQDKVGDYAEAPRISVPGITDFLDDRAPDIWIVPDQKMGHGVLSGVEIRPDHCDSDLNHQHTIELIRKV